MYLWKRCGWNAIQAPFFASWLEKWGEGVTACAAQCDCRPERREDRRRGVRKWPPPIVNRPSSQFPRTMVGRIGGRWSCCCRWPPGPITTPFFRTVEGRGRQRVELKRIALSSLSPFRGESPTLAYAHSLLCQKFVCRCGMPGRRTSCINRMRDAT